MSQTNNNNGLIDEILDWLVKAILRRWAELGFVLGVYGLYAYFAKQIGSVLSLVITVGLISLLLMINVVRQAIFNFLSRQSWQHKLDSAVAMSDSSLASRGPLVQKVERKRSCTKLTLRLKSGTTIHDLERIAPLLAVHHRLGAVRVESDHRDLSVVYLKLIKGSPLSDGVAAWPGKPGRFRSVWDGIPIGIDEDGEIVTVHLAEHSFLLGGEPGSGKSVLLATFLAYLVQDPTVALYIFDGKPPELNSWKPLAKGYVGTDINASVAMLDSLHLVMKERYLLLEKLQVKKISPSIGVPLVVVIIDELPFYLRNPDVKASKEFYNKLQDLIARCRAAGIVIILSAQKPSTDAVPSLLRDLVSVRVAFRCSTSDASDTILGSGWASQGYSASSISLYDRGVGLMLGESSVPVMFRSFWLDDPVQTEIIEAALKSKCQSTSSDSCDSIKASNLTNSSDPINASGSASSSVLIDPFIKGNK